MVRLDAIGDYVLFRNFIAELANSQRIKGKKIHLLGNIVWKDVFEEFDQEYVEFFIELDRTKFYRNLLYRYKKLKQLSVFGYQTIISPVYSRDFFFADSVVALLNAEEKIGSRGDYSNLRRWQKAISDNYYTRLVPSRKDLMFEFDRNLEFFEGLLETKLNISRPVINLPNAKTRFNLSPDYAVLFVGASAKYRKWKIDNFVKVAWHLKSCFGLDIVLCGASQDISDSLRFEQVFEGKVFNLVGKTSLVDLMEVLNNSRVLISNETSAPHFAVALDKPEVFVVSNGNHFGRFTPYPKEMTNKYHVVYHPYIEANLHNYQELSNSYGYGSNLDINEISADAVIQKIYQVLKDKRYEQN